jgi:hypothetical protein
MTPFHALGLQSHIMIIDSDVLQTHSLIQVIGGFRHSRALVTGQQLSRPFCCAQQTGMHIGCGITAYSVGTV